MRGLFFEDRLAPVARSPYRADVALFVGYVDRWRRKHLPGGAPDDEAVVQPIVHKDSQLYRWLVREGWARGNPTIDAANNLDELIDVPVPIDRVETFDRLFAGDRRPWGDPRLAQTCETYLSAAVRSFFVQGGRLCYVVRVGSPARAPAGASEVLAAIADRDVRVAPLIPDGPSATDRATWRGVWTLFGLPDVSFVALPDLPELVRGPLRAEPPARVPPGPPVTFEVCAEPAAPEEPDQRVHDLIAASSDEAGYAAWSAQLTRLVDAISERRPAGGLREVQIVAAVPRPSDEVIGTDLWGYLGSLALPRSAFLQLAYPWLSTARNALLPENIEPPEGTLCGVLARNALERGTYRSAVNLTLVNVADTVPKLTGRDLADPADLSTLGAHATLLGNSAAGFVVLSDVTTSSDRTFRLAHANRCVAALVRALRVTGEHHAFDVASERLWEQLAERARDVLREFWHAGALRGATADDAFTVRCDRSTMSQADIDAGRTIVSVDIALTVSLQRINVVLTRTPDGIDLERAA
jgi:hypothetical protein